MKGVPLSLRPWGNVGLTDTQLPVPNDDSFYGLGVQVGMGCVGKGGALHRWRGRRRVEASVMWLNLTACEVFSSPENMC